MGPPGQILPGVGILLGEYLGRRSMSCEALNSVERAIYHQVSERLN